MSAGLFFTTALDPYRFGLAVSIAQDRKTLSDDLRRLDRRCGTKARANILQDFDRLSPMSRGFVLAIGDGDAFMWLRELPTTTETAGVALHEMLHVVGHCLHDRGIKMGRSSTSQEPYCYLLEHLHNKLYEHVNEHLKRKR